MDDEDFEDHDYPVYFDGVCTCDHKQDEHGWCGCEVDDCECEAGWAE